MEHFEKVFQCFPAEIRAELGQLPPDIADAIEEIRVYRGRGVQVFAQGHFISIKGSIDGTVITDFLNSLMKFSYYAYEEDIAKGFITIDGGHRVGICGKTVLDKGRVVLIRDVSSLNIRYSREVKGCAKALMPMIQGEDNRLQNLLIASPPGCGKTTLLRDIASCLSAKNIKTAVCDERSEICGMNGGCPSYEFGVTLDVLDGCPKAEGMKMMIRAMSPQVIITDEIGKKEDVSAIKDCLNTGVKIITSIHAETMDDLKKSEIGELIDREIFENIVFLTRQPKVGTIKEVYHA